MENQRTLDISNAEQLFKIGKFQEAERLCRQILTNNPEDTAATYLLGCIAGRAGDFENAARLIGKVAEANPENTVYQLDLAGVLLNIGRVGDAEILLTALVEREPGNPTAFLILGHTLVRQDKVDAAHENWHRHMSLKCRRWMDEQRSAPDHPFNTDQFNFPDYEGNRLSYVICSTGRSGSTLLGDLLVQSGVMGAPHEYMNISSNGAPLANLLGIGPTDPLFFRNYFDAIKRVRTSPNGVFGIKMHYNQFENLIQPPLLNSVLPDPKFVQIVRRNRVAQAVSFAIALQTEKWNSTREAQKEAHYDMASVDKCLSTILQQESRWEKFFQIHRIDRHIVYYEDLVADSAGACRDVAAFLGVDTDYGFDISESLFERLGGQKNADWEERYRSEKSVL